MKRLLIILSLCCPLLAACSRPISTSAVSTPENGALFSVDQVEVTQGAGVRVSGSSTLPTGECIQTQLVVQNEAVDWWPEDVCIEPDAGQWELVVALGREDAPANLDPDAAYALQVWSPDHPETPPVRFPLTVQ